MQILLFVSLAVAILTVVFALQNNAPTSLGFLSWTFESSLAVVILVAVAAGALVSFLAALPGMVRLKWHLRSARQRIAQLEAAIAKAGVPARGGGAREHGPGPEVGAGP
jgi:uncharacterized integral membrane protein